MKKWLQNNRNGGFSLVEMLAAVAILVILLGVSAVAAAYYMDYLKITELDNAAREIYMAAENRAALLSSGRRLTRLVSRADNTLNDVEAGAEGRYISDSDSAIGDLLPAGSIDPALLEGHFYLVYEPVSGCVTDVFYAQDEINATEGSFQDFYNQWKNAARDERMRRKPMLGYYGGGKADGADGGKLHTPGVTVLIHNEEELWVEVNFLVPADAAGATVTKTVTLEYDGSSIDLMDITYNKRLMEPVGPDSTTYKWRLDALPKANGDPGAPFCELFGGSSGNIFGQSFTVTATIETSAPGKKSESATASDSNNSLFAKESGGGTAKIQYLRHLQNLDAGFSKVDGSFTSAVQQADVRCFSSETYPEYHFQPIRNEHITSYNGQKKEIRDLYVDYDGPAGLFSTLESNMGFEGVRLVNATVTGQKTGGLVYAGGLVGAAMADVSFDDCWVYWDDSEEDYATLMGQNEAIRYRTAGITGASSGGLIGEGAGKVTITNCLSATLLYGSSLAGGLAGQIKGDLTITGSYADCYLKGGGCAGLVGEGAGVQLINCYAAGFIDMTEAKKAAGLCLGSSNKVETQKVYSVMRPLYKKDAGSSAPFYYLTETQDRPNNDDFREKTCYLDLGLSTCEAPTAASVQGLAYGEMRDETSLDMGGAFTWRSSADSHPYRLRTVQELGTYLFPRLSHLPHYGDWTTEFTASLVYYEQYELQTGEDAASAYRFSGGGVRLLDDRTIVLDGYALAFWKKDLENKALNITYTYYDKEGNERSISHEAEKRIPVKVPKEDGVGFDDYILIPLPEDIHETASPSFYQYLKVVLQPEGGESTESEYFYNPHFAETVKSVNAQERPAGGWTKATADSHAGDLIASDPTVNLRTPRHLFELSRHTEYCGSRNYRFQQRLDLDYSTYTGYKYTDENGVQRALSETGFRQAPIGTVSAPFQGSYNGNYHTVRNVMFDTQDTNCAGLFGCSTGALSNLVYHIPPQQTASSTQGGGLALYLGGLLGWNRDGGRVTNCAVSGVVLDVRGSFAWSFIGGLVGQNDGTIQSCGVESPSLTVESNGFGTSHVGGLAGGNTGWIGSSYAVGRLESKTDRDYTTVLLGGFVGDNTGTISNSYTAAHLKSSGGGATVGGFCAASSGTQSGTYYLNMGNFTYRDIPYAAVYKDESGAQEITCKALTETQNLSGMGRSEVGIKSEDGKPVPYPYPTGVTSTVKTETGSVITWIYPGEDWPELMELGEMGVYYWEKLSTGEYYVSLLAADAKARTVTKQNTLLTTHDDGAVVTEYGYGYYAADFEDGEEARQVTAKAERILYYNTDAGKGENFQQDRAQTPEEEEADRALKRLMPGYTFQSYRSLDLDKKAGGLYPSATTDKPNGALTLTQTGELAGKPFTAKITFELNPFFADAMAVTTLPDGWTAKDVPLTGGKTSPGLEENPYGVRAIAQLEFINWNNSETNLNTTTVMTETNYAQFPYLSNTGTKTQYHWKQSHDIKGELEADGETYKTYTPIAEYYDTNFTDGTVGVLMGWFGGVYDGDDYVIENVNIQGQQSSCAGLFGVVYDGKLRHVILYSSDGKGVISTKANGVLDASTRTKSRWYAMGALAGVVGSSKKGIQIENGKAVLSSGDTIVNCSVAGYKIDAAVYTAEGAWGGNNIGGLIGTTDQGLSGCTAVTTIEIHDANENDNMRVGGLVGVCQGLISNCYAGGSISFTGENPVTLKDEKGVYIGGLVAGSYMKPLKVGGSTSSVYVGADPTNGTRKENTSNGLTNCYSYVKLPAYTALGDNKDTKFINRKIKAIFAVGGAGEINALGEVDNGNILRLADKAWEYENKSYNAANHGECTITNCYYLKNEALADNEKSSSLAVSLEEIANTTVWQGDKWIGTGVKTDIASPVKSIALSFEELESKTAVKSKKGDRTIYQWLNDPDGQRNLTADAAKTAGPFHAVTTEVTFNGGTYSVPGKYSYPPSSRSDLLGMDYPFPTVLTRTEEQTDHTLAQRNVHYGQWPINGIRRDKGDTPILLDIFVDGGAVTETLELTKDVKQGGTWTVEMEDGSIAKLITSDNKEAAALTVKDEKGVLSLPILAVPPVPEGDAPIDLEQIGGMTAIKVKYQEPGTGGNTYERSYTVRVSAELKVSPPQITLFTNDVVTLQPTLVNQRDEQMTGEPIKGELKLTDVQSEGTVKAEADWKNEGGDQTADSIELTSGATPTTQAPEAVRVKYRFTLEDKTYAGSGSVLVRVVAPDVAAAEDAPEGKEKYVVTFGGEAVENLSARSEPNVPEVEIEPKEAGQDTPAQINVTVPAAPEGTEPQEITLKVTLTLDGRQHELAVTLPPPKPEEDTE